MLGQTSRLGAKSPGDWGQDGRLTLGVLGMYPARGIGEWGDAGVLIVMGVCVGEGKFSLMMYGMGGGPATLGSCRDCVYQVRC